MRWSDIPFKPSSTTLRWFGGVGALILAGLAGLRFVHADATSALVLAGLALVVGLVTCVYPSALRPVFVGWMIITYPLNWTVSQVLLACVFYCIFAPLGLFLRLIGRDDLALRTRGRPDTYWTAKPTAEDVRRYFRQF